MTGPTVTWGGATYPIPAELTNREKLQVERIGGAPLGDPDLQRGKLPYGIIIGMLVVAAARQGVTLDVETLMDSTETVALNLGVEEEGEVTPTVEEDAQPDSVAPPTPIRAAGTPSTSEPLTASNPGR